MFIKFYRKPCYLILMALIFFLYSGVAVSTAAPDTSVEKVSIQLKWFHQFQFAGYYAALEKGYYLEEGLNVDIIEGGPTVKVDKVVTSGKAQYGVLGSELILKRAQGEPVVMLAVIMQHSVRTIIVRKNSEINSPATLADHLMMLNRNEDAEFLAMFNSEGVALNKLNIIQKEKTANKKFINGEIDALNGSIANQPFFFKNKGIDVRLIRPINYGIDFYGDSLFTSEAEIENNPHRVDAFIRATIKGWAYAFDNPDEIIDLILRKYNAKKSREHLQFEALKLRDIVLPDLVDIGHMSSHRISHIEKIYKELNIIKPEAIVKGLLYNPDNSKSRRFIRIITITLSSVAAVIFIVGGLLLGFNRRLSRLVKLKTIELERNYNLLYSSQEALLKSEEQLRSIAEASPDYIIHLDLELRVRYINRIYPKMEKESILGVPIYTLVDKERQVDLKKTLESVIRTGEVVRYETVYNHHGGDDIFFESSAAAIFDDKRITGLTVTSRDITQRKKFDEEKKQLEVQLVQFQKMEAIGTLAGGIAHDFNNILTAIVGFTELAIEDTHDGTLISDNLDQVLTAAMRAKALVSQILTYSRQKEHELEPVNISTIVNEAVDLIRATIPATIRIRKAIDSDCGTILADSTQLHQVVMNLCTNAYHAMIEKGGILGISLSKTIIGDEDQKVSGLNLMPGSHIRLEISDTGWGMERDVLEKIFDPYFTTKKQGQGSGMGLSVAQGIIKSMNGIITVYSEPDKGTCFKIYLPGIGGDAIENDDIDICEEVKGRENVLFVDDEESITTYGQQMFERLGYKISVFSGSLAALEHFKLNPNAFDIVITDMAMPDMDGAELAKNILRIRYDIPIILCTGFSEVINGEFAKIIGIKEFLTKPVTKNDMATTVRRVLDSVNTGKD